MDTTSDSSTHKLQLRNLRPEDYADVKEIMDRVYPSSMGGAWEPDEYKAQISTFPEGQICIEDNGKVVAAALSMIIDYDEYRNPHTYDDIIGKGYFKNHDPDGNCLYGIDVFVHPEYQGLRLGRRLYDARKELCENLNLRGILLGGRIPGYKEYHKEYTPQQYIQRVKNKEIHDPVLSFQLANDFHIKKGHERVHSRRCPIAIVWYFTGMEQYLLRTETKIDRRAQKLMYVWGWYNGRCVYSIPLRILCSKWNSS